LLTLLVLTLAHAGGPAAFQGSGGDASSRQPALSVDCGPTTLSAPWNGSDTASCTISATSAVPSIVLSCSGLPDGARCQLDPSSLSARPNERLTASLSVIYTAQMPAGRFPLQIGARGGESSATTSVVVVKDANTVTARCPSDADIAAINRDLRLSFDGDPTRSTQDCTFNGRFLTVMQSRIYRALVTMRHLSFTEPLPWTRETLYQWFVRVVDGIRFRTDIPISQAGRGRTIEIKSSVEGGSGFALAMTGRVPGNGDFRIYDTFLGLLVHEARHLDGKPHTCGTRDRTVAEMGAWASQRAFHLWVADRTAPDFLPPELRALNRQHAALLCKTYFCEACRD
jgi:hypothetical protein